MHARVCVCVCVCVYVCVCVCARARARVCVPGCMAVYHMCAEASGDQERALNPLELELQMIMSHHVALTIGPSSSARADSVLNQVVSLVQTCIILKTNLLVIGMMEEVLLQPHP